MTASMNWSEVSQGSLPFEEKPSEAANVAELVTQEPVDDLVVIETDSEDDLFTDDCSDEVGQTRLFTAILQQAINDFLREVTHENPYLGDIDAVGVELIRHCRHMTCDEDIPKPILKFLRSLPEYSASSWFLSDYQGPYSYRWVCNQFEPAIDADALLDQIVLMPKSSGGLKLNTKKLYIRSSSDPAQKKSRRKRRSKRKDEKLNVSPIIRSAEANTQDF